ncbi:tyrosine-type recombinase/integrase [Nocardiopsis rhodophaea]|uniref:tyrosine-type recombinase/integrase n=1 Tax=Nocardiopsis rhodophaea TaxID=280238 RepID=UPI0031D9B2C1
MTQIHGGSMFVQRVVSPVTRQESWTVLGEDDVPIGPVERYLSYLTDIERSPNTIKAYAHDLKDYFGFLAQHGLDWREVRLEDLGDFVAWLRRPPRLRNGDVVVLGSAEAHCTEPTVNRKLSALSAFHEHAARNGVDLGELLITWQPTGRRPSSWKPFLHHVSAGRPVARRTIKLKAPKKLPRVLTAAEPQSVLDACGRLRDRFLFALLHESGVRAGRDGVWPAGSVSSKSAMAFALSTGSPRSSRGPNSVSRAWPTSTATCWSVTSPSCRLWAAVNTTNAWSASWASS